MMRRSEGGIERIADFRLDRRTLLKRAGSLGVAASALGFLEACGGSGDEPDESVATTLRIRNASVAEPARIDPIYPTGDADVRKSILEGLIGSSPEGGEPVNILAETFELSRDRGAIDFVLKRGVKFHRGFGEVTAEDVKFSLERAAGITKSKEPSAVKGLFEDLERVDVNDTYSGRIVLKRPSVTFLASGVGEPPGAILSKKAFAELGEKGHFANPVGTGPYQFDKWNRGRNITLKNFEEYSGAAEFVPKTRFKSVVYSFIPNDTAAEAAFDTGELDFLIIPATAAQRFEGKSEAEVFKKTTMGGKWIGMNVLDPALKNRDLRLAIRAGIDVSAILEGIGGDKPRANAIVPPTSPIGYWKDAPVHERDVDEAKRYVESVPEDDRTLTFTIANEEEPKIVAQVVQQYLAEVGITIKIVTLDSSSFYVTGAENRKRQLHYTGYGGYYYNEPTVEFVYQRCDQIDLWNWNYWCNEEFDALFKRAASEFDRTERNAIYIEMQRIWEEAANTVFVGREEIFYVARRDTVEPVFSPAGNLIGQAFIPA